MKIEHLESQWKEVYIRLIEAYHVKPAVAVAQRYRPNKLYKYFNFDPYWRKNIYGGEIVFNNPSNYNDPMDSRWFLDYERIVEERLKESNGRWNDAEIRALVRQSIPLYEEDLYYLRHLFKISCFSESPCSNLMWGHYADKHRGFCLEYDVEKLESQTSIMLPVIYSEKPFQAWRLIDKKGLDDEFLELIPFLYKSCDWSYEREWRTFIPAEHDDIVIVPVSNCITGVYFGFKSYSDERTEIEEWAKENGITIYQMERTYCSYDFVYDVADDIKQKKSRKGLLF